jgi:hypothetical protein
VLRASYEFNFLAQCPKSRGPWSHQPAVLRMVEEGEEVGGFERSIEREL